MALRTRLRSTIIAAFAADAMSLGPHWEYDTNQIRKQFPNMLKQLHDPLSSYHPNKKAGDSTHIGDNARYLLQYLASTPAPHHFDPVAYTAYWYNIWNVPTPPAYVDHVTKDKIKDITEATKKNPGASLTSVISSTETTCPDDDLSHSSKLFALLSLDYQNEDQLVADAVKLEGVFQIGEQQQATAEYLARVTYRVIYQGIEPNVAVKTVAADMKNEWITGCLNRATESLSLPDATTALRSYGEKKTYGEKTLYTGLSCGVKYGLPAVMRSVLAHAADADPSDAVIEDINIGGNL